MLEQDLFFSPFLGRVELQFDFFAIISKHCLALCCDLQAFRDTPFFVTLFQKVNVRSRSRQIRESLLYELSQIEESLFGLRGGIRWLSAVFYLL